VQRKRRRFVCSSAASRIHATRLLDLRVGLLRSAAVRARLAARPEAHGPRRDHQRCAPKVSDLKSRPKFSVPSTSETLQHSQVAAGRVMAFSEVGRGSASSSDDGQRARGDVPEVLSEVIREKLQLQLPRTAYEIVMVALVHGREKPLGCTVQRTRCCLTVGEESGSARNLAVVVRSNNEAQIRENDVLIALTSQRAGKESWALYDDITRREFYDGLCRSVLLQQRTASAVFLRGVAIATSKPHQLLRVPRAKPAPRKASLDLLLENIRFPARQGAFMFSNRSAATIKLTTATHPADDDHRPRTIIQGLRASRRVEIGLFKIKRTTLFRAGEPEPTDATVMPYNGRPVRVPFPTADAKAVSVTIALVLCGLEHEVFQHTNVTDGATLFFDDDAYLLALHGIRKKALRLGAARR